MRNPNGYGTVYKLKGNRRRPWIARVTVGWDIEKKRQKQQTLGYFAKREDGLAALAAYHNNPAPKATITLGELYNEWSDQKYSGISKSMENGYRAAWKRLAGQKDTSMRELRTVHLQKVIDECRGLGMSRSSLEKIKTLCIQLCKYAAENDIVTKNYAEFIKLPKTSKAEKVRFTDIEVKKIEESNIPWADTILILIYTGMRINELLGLTRFSVDLDRNVLVGGLKTDAGKNRVVPIHPKILPLIKKWYNRGGEYLICKNDGSRVSDRWYREKAFRPTLQQIGVRVLNPHACRHTCASLLHAAGVDARTVQEILGHANYSTTADMYTHVDVKKLQDAIQQVN